MQGFQAVAQSTMADFHQAHTEIGMFGVIFLLLRKNARHKSSALSNTLLYFFAKCESFFIHVRHAKLLQES